MKITIPKPFSIAIDDLGWMRGSSDHLDGTGPYRLGLKRQMDVSDYEALVELGRQVGTRLQGLFILGEMDRENILGKFPSTTQMRENWNNRDLISDLQLQIVEYLSEHSAHLEFGFHGIGHEFWKDKGERRRAEWYNTEEKHPWPEKDLRNHMECAVHILKQYGLSPELGHSFPESFVPCAYSYYWNPESTYSLGSILTDYGIKYANTDFREIPECNPPEGVDSGGLDHGVHVLNRYNYGNLWYELGQTPKKHLIEESTSFVEAHWPNLLAQDDFLQSEITEKWIEYYRDVQNSEDRFISKNTALHHAQWLYNKYTKLEQHWEGLVSIDTTRLPQDVKEITSEGNLVLQVKTGANNHVNQAKINGDPIAGYYKEGEFSYLYLPPLDNGKHHLTYDIGKEMPAFTVWHDGTSNILHASRDEDSLIIALKQYGCQPLKIITDKSPFSIHVNNPKIKILGWSHIQGILSIELRAHDIQGEKGIIHIKF